MARKKKNLKIPNAVNIKLLDEAAAKWLKERRVITQSHLDRINAEIDYNEANIGRFRSTATIAAHLKSLPLLLKVKPESRHGGSASETPPKLPQYLIYLVFPRNNREIMLGDLDEEYREVYEKFGLRAAKLFYYIQVIRSIWPIVGEKIKLIMSSIKLFIVTK
jgi:hypothetical protein